MNPIRVHVRLFGAFRKYSSGSELTLDVPRGTRVSALRGGIAEALRRRWPNFSDDGLLTVSVLADDQRILDDGDSIEGGLDHISLAVLPPVCGG